MQMAASATKNSPPRSSAASKLIDRMKVYSSFRPDQVPEYLKALGRMLGEYGEDRLNRGLTAAIDAIQSFPPTPAEIRKYIPPLTIETCGKCDAGWVVANPEAKRSEQKVRRCGCV